jgi:DNA (cytosine-5)-methyltransferase 1
MLNGLDLFSGIGGLTVALAPWVRPVAYCENDRYVQGVMLSAMRRGDIHQAPIWDDVRSLSGGMFDCQIEIIYGGFPCQDISCAGAGRGLEGERSGLVFEVFRLVDELRPAFVFLENVPAIVTRGLSRVVGELTARGYECRWKIISAADVGANHIRRRWWLLAYTGQRRWAPRLSGTQNTRANAKSKRAEGSDGTAICGSHVADSEGLTERAGLCTHESTGLRRGRSSNSSGPFGSDWWTTEPDVGRVAHGVSARVDRLRGLGNAVVPYQARTAFRELAGIA